MGGYGLPRARRGREEAIMGIRAAGLVAALCASIGCAGDVATELPDCSDLTRGDVAALLGVEMPDGCDRVPSAQDFVTWRASGEFMADGSALCVYRAGGAPGLSAEIVTIDGVPVDASVTAPPRTTCTCVATVTDVCMASGECAVLD
jgi:hypothetical protein